MSPTFDKPKSVSLMCPIDVINRLQARKNIRKRTFIVRLDMLWDYEPSITNFYRHS